MSKNVMIIFAGGASFCTPGLDSMQGQFQATRKELEQHIGRDMAARLAPEIHADLKYVGGSFNGANEGPKDWNNLGQIVADSYHDYDGFVILHGQDLIPWAASQLAYSFQNLAKPVIFADGSKAEGVLGIEKTRQMIITAAQLAAFSNIPESCVLSAHDILLKGVDALQYNANQHCSFISRNDRILAHIGADFVREEGNIRPIPTDDFLYLPMDTSIKINMYPATFYPMHVVAEEDIAGLVIKAAGAGDIHLNQFGVGETLELLRDRRVPVVAITNDTHGYIDFDRVPNSAELRELNVIQGGSMTDAASITKLRAAISMQIPYEDMNEFMHTDMFGETKSKLPKIEIPGDGFTHFRIA